MVSIRYLRQEEERLARLQRLQAARRVGSELGLNTARNYAAQKREQERRVRQDLESQLQEEHQRRLDHVDHAIANGLRCQGEGMRAAATHALQLAQRAGDELQAWRAERALQDERGALARAHDNTTRALGAHLRGSASRRRQWVKEVEARRSDAILAQPRTPSMDRLLPAQRDRDGDPRYRVTGERPVTPLGAGPGTAPRSRRTGGTPDVRPTVTIGVPPAKGETSPGEQAAAQLVEERHRAAETAKVSLARAQERIAQNAVVAVATMQAEKQQAEDLACMEAEARHARKEAARRPGLRGACGPGRGHDLEDPQVNAVDQQEQEARRAAATHRRAEEAFERLFLSGPHHLPSPQRAGDRSETDHTGAIPLYSFWQPLSAKALLEEPAGPLHTTQPGSGAGGLRLATSPCVVTEIHLSETDADTEADEAAGIACTPPGDEGLATSPPGAHQPAPPVEQRASPVDRDGAPWEADAAAAPVMATAASGSALDPDASQTLPSPETPPQQTTVDDGDGGRVAPPLATEDCSLSGMEGDTQVHHPTEQLYSRSSSGSTRATADRAGHETCGSSAGRGRSASGPPVSTAAALLRARHERFLLDLMALQHKLERASAATGSLDSATTTSMTPTAPSSITATSTDVATTATGAARSSMPSSASAGSDVDPAHAHRAFRRAEERRGAAGGSISSSSGSTRLFLGDCFYSGPRGTDMLTDEDLSLTTISSSSNSSRSSTRSGGGMGDSSLTDSTSTSTLAFTPQPYRRASHRGMSAEEHRDALLRLLQRVAPPQRG